MNLGSSGRRLPKAKAGLRVSLLGLNLMLLLHWGLVLVIIRQPQPDLCHV
jgi:hypothetical protein